MALSSSERMGAVVASKRRKYGKGVESALSSLGRMTSIHPVLKYDDAHAAIDFLERAFGFERVAVHENDDGQVVHAELRSGDGVASLSSTGAGDSVYDQCAHRACLYVVVDEVDPLFERAKGAGAEIVMEPTDQDYGSRDFSVRDPEGNIWAFGTYALGS
jgi:uncharacterized glyoxalase superfamily protein PhnB